MWTDIVWAYEHLLIIIFFVCFIETKNTVVMKLLEGSDKQTDRDPTDEILSYIITNGEIYHFFDPRT